MRKILMAALIIPILIFSGCYDDENNKNAIVRINLGNIPINEQACNNSFFDKVFSVFVKEAYAQTIPSNIIKIHLAAFKDNKLIVSKSIAKEALTSDVVEWSIPADDGITIVVLGERYENPQAIYNDIYYYGKSSNPLNLVSGVTQTLNIQMELLDDLFVNCTATEQNGFINWNWNNIYGATNYIVYNESSEVVKKDLINSFVNESPLFYMEIEFSFAGKSSISFTLPGI